MLSAGGYCDITMVYERIVSGGKQL